MGRNLTRIVFVYHRRSLKIGTTLMRSVQLRDQIAPHLEGVADTAVSSMPGGKYPVLQLLWARMQKPGSVLFFTKKAWPRLQPDTADVLKKRECRICFDYVDADLRSMPVHGVDLHVAASSGARQMLRKIRAKREAGGQRV